MRESVGSVHKGCADLKTTISKQKDDIKHELANRIDVNTDNIKTEGRGKT